jgi:hypothetical protein
MAHDELEVRRWFRRTLQAIGKAYPELKDPGRQEACTEWVETVDMESAVNASSDRNSAED